MMGGSLSGLAAQIAATNEVLRAFAATDFSLPFAPAADGPQPSPTAPGPGGGPAVLPPVDRPSPGGPQADPSRSLDGLRPPSFAAGAPSAGGGRDAAEPADAPPNADSPALAQDAGRPPRGGADRAIASRPDARTDPDGSVPMPRPGTDASRPDGTAGGPMRPGTEPPQLFAFAAAEPQPGAGPEPAADRPAEAPPPSTDRAGPAAASAALPVPAAAEADPTAAEAAESPARDAGAALPRPTQAVRVDGTSRRSSDPPRPTEAAASAAKAPTPEAARAVAAHAGPSLPVVLREAVAGLDLRFASEGASAAAVDLGAAAATVIFNAATIPGWPPPRPFDVPDPEAMLGRLLEEPASAEDEAALAGDLAARCGAPGQGATLQAQLRRLSRARRLRALFGLAALMDTIESVIEAVEAELLELSRAGRDGEDDWAEAGTRRQLTA